MTEKFTQGEWTAHIGIMEPTYIFIGKEDDYVDGETPVICELHHGIKKKYPGSHTMDFDHTEMNANAALIAAAPKMYNRLKEVKSDFRALLFNPYISEHTKECIKIMIDHIEDDLKKARGEE